jgi:UDP-3-O-[3-hydroxymyristoyl] glucosamine N-acyltransferase
MKYTLNDIVKITGGEVVGDGDTVVTGVASLRKATGDDLSFARDEAHLPAARESAAGAFLLPACPDGFDRPAIVVENPFLAMTTFLAVLADAKTAQPPGIHPTAVVGEGTRLGEGVSLGAGVVVGRECAIGDRCTIHPNVTVGDRCRIGEGTVLYAGVVLREEVEMGCRCIVHPNTTIGSDGFGYLQEGGKHEKIPQVGTVEIGDDVEIGAGCAIDRAALDKTVIGSGCKLDNHCHIAHNVEIGENTIMMAYGKISGSVKIGRNVILAGDASTVDNIEIGDGCIIGAGSGIAHSMKPGEVVWGKPARPIGLEKRIVATLGHLPQMRRDLKHLKRELEKDRDHA